MWLRWFPWKYVVSRVAQRRGLIDPISVLSRLERFAQPLEIKEPLEFFRAGLVLHARGLLNTNAIQHNLDWIWPYWVERQYDPKDESFIPRSFAITHVNLTHRNWTAVGIPDCDDLPIVDPRGLVTPFWDGWSLDTWMLTESGGRLIPSQLEAVEQHLDIQEGVTVVTHSRAEGLELTSRVAVRARDGSPTCQLDLTAKAATEAWLVLALRPYNPEGVSFIHEVRMASQATGWKIDGRHRVRFSAPAARYDFSDYRSGDVAHRLPSANEHRSVRCGVGMATAAAQFAVTPDRPCQLQVQVPLGKKTTSDRRAASAGLPSWSHALRGHCELSVPDPRIQYLYDAALRTLVLHSPGEVYPGPYTYKRFWFRDATFILHALLCAGLEERVERVLDRFPTRQTPAGFFRSQDNEWDSNGEALWILDRFRELTGRKPKQAWRKAIRRGARWIVRKRLSDKLDTPHAGLLPAGFSAEHLGPNDYYYWDDFWSVAGLRAAANLLDTLGEGRRSREFRREADRLTEAINQSLAHAASRCGCPGMPASPYRRMDSGAVGSLAGGYPLELLPPTDERLLGTTQYLIESCFVDGGFFQDMVHSGINPYLTLHVAQVLLRAGDMRCLDMMQRVAELASPTGQWPEAIHPRTGGGCMGDGHHAWAAAEWILYIRNSFVRQEPGGLILASGIPPAWLDPQKPLSLGPTPTRFGPISVRLRSEASAVVVQWTGQWRADPPSIEVRLPGWEPAPARRGEAEIRLERGGR